MSRFFSVVAMVLTLGMAPTVRATTVSECLAQIDTLQQELAAVVIGGNNPDRTRAGLDSKLSNASTKLDQAKFCDSIVKLTDFRDSVLQLAVPNAKGEYKMSPQDANSLASGADDATICIRDLAPTCR
jgi:hypothetical protein